MKYIFYLLLLFEISFCNKKKAILTPHTMEEVVPALKKSLLECISKSESASEELKNYANENLSKELKDHLHLSQFKGVETDKLVIRKCRREAFLQSKKAAPKLEVVKEPVLLKK